jgi:hypothetical protein
MGYGYTYQTVRLMPGRLNEGSDKPCRNTDESPTPKMESRQKMSISQLDPKGCLFFSRLHESLPYFRHRADEDAPRRYTVLAGAEEARLPHFIEEFGCGAALSA